MSGNPWFRNIIAKNYARGSYNQDCQDHADRMQELSVLYTEKEWLEKRAEIVNDEIKRIEKGGM